MDNRYSIAFKVSPLVAEQFNQAVREIPITKKEIISSLMLYFTHLSKEERLTFVMQHRPPTEE